MDAALVLAAALAVAAILIGLLFAALRRTRAEARELRGRLHGERVKGGYVAESLAPLAEEFPVDVGKPGTSTVFLGQPIDYIYFDPEMGVSFIEVKSGRSDLSKRQRQLRDRIDEGRVEWLTHRVE